ncbi:MAG: amino acid racemase [Pseudomonadota bacterium]
MRRVGVIGGLGPEATVLFMSRLIAAVPARDDADHVPLIVDQNPQVPSRIDALVEGCGPDPSPILIDMARRLERAGAAALVMPCNTAHHYAACIQDAVSIPFLSMVDLAATHAAQVTRWGRVGLLGSPALERAGVFDLPMAAQGVRVVPLTDPHAMLGAIRAIKARGTTPEVCAQLSREAHAQARAGAEAICIGCTEFSLVAKEIEAPVPVFDALDLLVETVVRFSRDGRVPFAHAAPVATSFNREKEVT